MSKIFTPLNDFEAILEKAQAGEIPQRELIAGLIVAKMALPSAGNVQSDWSGFQPLLFDKNGVPMLACFSSKERISEYVDIAPYCLLVIGGEMLSRLPVGYGIVVNPGQSIGFDIPPDGVAEIVADFGI